MPLRRSRALAVFAPRALPSQPAAAAEPRPLPHRPLPPPHVLPDVLHLLPPDRLQKVVLRAQADALEHRLGMLVGRHHHDGHRPQARFGADVAEQLDAVDVGHHDVREDEVERPGGVGAELLDRLEAGLDVGDYDFFGGFGCKSVSAPPSFFPTLCLFFFQADAADEPQEWTAASRVPVPSSSFFFPHLPTFVATLPQQARHDHPLHSLVVDEQDVDFRGRERGSGRGSGCRRRIRRRQRRIEASSASALALRRRRATSHPAQKLGLPCSVAPAGARGREI